MQQLFFLRNLCFLLFLVGSSLVCFVSSQEEGLKANGIVYVGWNTGDYSTASAKTSLQLLANVVNAGAKYDNSSIDAVPWTAILETYYSANINSTSISFAPGRSQSDADLMIAINNAKSFGLKVALKPHVDLLSGDWRGFIGTYFNSVQWEQWFASYQVYLTHMATLAEQLEVDLLVIGTELSATQGQDALWRKVVAAIREEYSGPLVYGSNHGESNMTWWDVLDYVGVDAYYPLSHLDSPTIEVLVEGWAPLIDVLADLSANGAGGLPIIFTEIGYQSTVDAAITPWAANGALSLQTQANCYTAFYRAIWPQPWFQGAFWWAWDTNPNDGGPTDTDFTPNGKPASTIVSQH